MFTSNRLSHDSGLYHEHIFSDNKIVAMILGEDDGTFWWVITDIYSISRGYKTVSDAKDILFKILSGT